MTLFGKNIPQDRRVNMPPWKLKPIEFLYLNLNENTASSNHTFARNVFREMMEAFQEDCITAFTDGSKSENKTACGVFIPKLEIRRSGNMTDNTSVFSVELMGIDKALEILYKKVKY